MRFPRSARLVSLSLFALFLACQFQIIHAQKKNEQKPLEVTKQDPPRPGQKPADYSQEAFVIEQMTTNYRFEKDGTGQRDMTVRVKVQSEAGLERFGQRSEEHTSELQSLRH